MVKINRHNLDSEADFCANSLHLKYQRKISSSNAWTFLKLYFKIQKMFVKNEILENCSVTKIGECKFYLLSCSRRNSQIQNKTFVLWCHQNKMGQNLLVWRPSFLAFFAPKSWKYDYKLNLRLLIKKTKVELRIWLLFTMSSNE